MTLKDDMLIKHPEAVDTKYKAGVRGCPIDYGYEDYVKCGKVDCEDCWNRDINIKEENKIMKKFDFIVSDEFNSEVVYIEAETFIEAVEILSEKYPKWDVNDFHFTEENVKVGAQLLHFHHTALSRGYIKKDEVKIRIYSGKFGVGYTIDRNNPQSTNYFLRDYYIY